MPEALRRAGEAAPTGIPANEVEVALVAEEDPAVAIDITPAVLAADADHQDVVPRPIAVLAHIAAPVLVADPKVSTDEVLRPIAAPDPVVVLRLIAVPVRNVAVQAAAARRAATR